MLFNRLNTFNYNFKPLTTPGTSKANLFPQAAQAHVSDTPRDIAFVLHYVTKGHTALLKHTLVPLYTGQLSW